MQQRIAPVASDLGSRWMRSLADGGERLRRGVEAGWAEIRGRPVSPVRVRRSRIGLLIAAAVGAVLAYFLDPDRGRTRRAKTRDQLAAAGRTLGDRLERRGRRITSDWQGKVERARFAERHYEPPNDATLAHKVESEVLGRAGMPKGSVSINSENRVIYLRGEVESMEEIRRLEEAVRQVQGVEGVENLLHVPGTPASNKETARQAGKE